MSVAAVIGAGEIGASVAQALARRAAFRDVRLIDESHAVAAGKALDILQSGPVDRFNTRLSASANVLDAAGADVIVIADAVEGGEWEGERGLALVRTLVASGTPAPLVFAGPKQVWLMEAAVRELKVPADRIVGSAAGAIAGSARALVGLELDGAGTDVAVTVTGRPPGFVVGWTAATVSGSPLTERVPAHRLLAIGDQLARLWPPKPYAIASATARVAEGLVFGSRRLVSATTVLDGELGVRGAAVMLPLVLGRGRVFRREVPTLSTQERVALVNSAGDRRP